MLSHPTPVHSGYHDNSSMWSRGCLDTHGGESNVRGGFPRKECKGKSPRRPIQVGEKEEAVTLLLLSINNSCKRASLVSLGSYLEAAEGETIAR